MKRQMVILFMASCTMAAAQQNKREQILEYLNQQGKDGFSGSILVAEKGVVLVDTGIGYADRESHRQETAETVFSVGSITKQFTAAAVLKLESEGKLSTSDSLMKYFPSVPDDKRNITLHQLLTHTAGLAEVLGDDYDTVNADAFITLAFQSELVHEPGSQFLYSNVGYSILGILVEKISGEGYEKFLREKLFLPAGMEHTGYVLPKFKKEQLATGYRNGVKWGTALDRPWMKDGPGWHLRANGGILSTTGDMYRWVIALTKYRVLPKIFVEKLFTPHVAEQAEQKSFYGYGWVIQPAGNTHLIWHNGGNGVYNAIVSFESSGDRCIIVSSNSNNMVSDLISLDIYNILYGSHQLHKPQEFDYRNNPVTTKILAAINSSGSGLFVIRSKEILTEAGFDFENDMQLLGVGEALEENNQWKEATALYQVYTHYFPKIVVAWNRLGKCYAHNGDMPKAKECWTTSVALRSVNNPAVSWLKEMK